MHQTMPLHIMLDDADDASTLFKPRHPPQNLQDRAGSGRGRQDPADVGRIRPGSGRGPKSKPRTQSLAPTAHTHLCLRSSSSITLMPTPAITTAAITMPATAPAGKLWLL